MKPHFLHFPPTLALLVCFLPTAWSQQTTASGTTAPDEEVFQMQALDVTSSRDVGYISQNAESATRMNVPIADVPQSILVFNQEFLQDIMAESIEDVAMYDPTVNAYSDNDDFTMRGIGGNARLRSGANYFNGFEQIPGLGSQTLVNTERVEMLKGPNAVLYGTGAFGGTINRVSKKPTSRKFTRVTAGLDSEGYYSVAVDDNSPVVPRKYAYRINAMWGDGETWYGMQRNSVVFAPGISWNITPRTILMVEYTFQKQKQPANWEFPVWGGDILNIVTRIDPSDVGIRHRVNPRRYLAEPGDFRNVYRNIFYADFRHEFSRNLIFRAMANAESRKIESKETLIESWIVTMTEDDAWVRRYFRQNDSDCLNYRLRGELIAQFPTFGLGHKMVSGLGWDKGRWDYLQLRSLNSDQTANPEMGLYPFPSISMLTGERRRTIPEVNFQAQPFTDYTQDMDSLSAYASDLITLVPDRLILQAGLRYITFKQTRDYATSPEDNYTITEDKFTHSVGLVWHLTKNRAWTLYANHCFTYKPNSQVDDDGEESDPLDSMTADQNEIGLKYVYKDKFSALLSYYDINQKNTPESYIEYAVNPDGSNISRTRWGLIKGLRSRGAEMNFQWNASEELSLFGGYGYNHCVNEDTGARHYYAPMHSFSAFGRYGIRRGALKGLSFNLGFIWRSSTVLQYQASTALADRPMWSVPSYQSINAGVSYGFRTSRKVRWSVAFKLSNATDHLNFYNTYNTRASLQAPRTWTLSLVSSF
ncbi:TonB-dependent receptor plug domain-containing protein [Termitidicoccus mucosus]